MRRYWIKNGDWDLEYFGFPVSTYELFELQGPSLKVYNPNEYKLKLKDGVIEKRIKEKEEQIRRFESQRDLEKAGWDDRIKQLQSDIDELKKKL
jgi:hypothetical protein